MRPIVTRRARVLGARVLIACSIAALIGCRREPPAAPPAPAKVAERAPASVPSPAPAPVVSLPVKRGGELYARMCAVCHGADGEGYRADRAPALHRDDFLGAVTDGYLRSAIMNGRRGSTMSAWSEKRGGPFSPADGEAMIAFLRTWQHGPRPRLDERPASGDPVRGAKIYARDCANCHGARGTGGPYVQIGAPELLASATHGMLRHAVRHGRPGTPMPSFEASLGEQGMEDVVAHVRDLGAQAAAPPPITHDAPASPLPLGKVPLNPRGPAPRGFLVHPETTPAEIVHREFVRKARMMLLDARAPSDYIREHIKGAVSVPFYDPTPYLDKLPKNTWLVCYCSCPLAESGALAGKLQAAGFSKVTVLAEGIPYWKLHDYGVRSGAKP